MMKFRMQLLVCVSMSALLAACAKTNVTPGDTSKRFLESMETTDVDTFMATLAPDFKAKIQASVPDIKQSLGNSSLKIKQCGGFKNLTPNYAQSEGATSVEGYTLIEYKGTCPLEKQYLKLVKRDNAWLVELPGPSVKQ